MVLRSKDRIAGAIVAAALLSSAGAAEADVIRFGRFSVDSAQPTVMTLSGDIQARSANDFDNALRRFPDVAALTLDSDGGDISATMAIAASVNARGFATAILANQHCYASCALIFFAGAERGVLGSLGVHRVETTGLDAASAQTAVGLFVQRLTSYGADPAVVAAMLTTGPDNMRVFTRAEIEALGINVPGDRLGPVMLASNAELEAVRAEANEAIALIRRDLSTGGLGLKAYLESTGYGDIDPAMWARYAAMLLEAFNEDFGEFFAERILVRGLGGGGEAIGVDAGSITALALEMMTSGLGRLSAEDQMTVFRFQIDTMDWIAEHEPEMCRLLLTGEAMATDPGLPYRVLADLSAEGQQFYFDVMLRSIRAEMEAKPPEVVVTPSRAVAVQLAYEDAVYEAILASPRVEAIVAAAASNYTVGDAQTFCDVATAVRPVYDQMDPAMLRDLVALSLQNPLAE